MARESGAGVSVTDDRHRVRNVANAWWPGRTGRSPTRNPHRPGRAQLRHPVPLVKVSLDTIRVHPFPLSVVVSFT